MFKRTKRRLVILNALVFFILQNLLGGMVFFYTKYSLYHQVDHTILEKEHHLLNDRDDMVNNDLNPEREENHRLVYLLWAKDGKLYRSIPKEATRVIDTASFSHFREKEGLQTVQVGSQSFRFVNLSVKNNKRYPSIEDIQIIYNLQREKEMLDHLLIVIGFGSVLSVFIAIIAGVYLANKALVPIRRSWEKQQQFVADASHELRTPLSVMKLNLEHLFRHPNHNIEQESETIHQVIQEINYLTKMSADLLTLARSDSDQLEVLKETLSLSEILSQVVKHFTSLAAMKNIKVSSDISPMTMMGDRERLKQLFIILLDNALKYTKEDGTIFVNAEVKNSRAIIEIADTGVGISREDLPFIFDRYFRGDKSRTRHLEGSGLGLSIAQWIVHTHNGKIKATSQVGEGTQFIISFPLK
jgi:two-component system, OmpR family, sensor histidine kinase CiaH